MPAPDAIQGAVKNALIKEGWTITDDPFVIFYERLRLFADLGAERPIGAERAGQALVAEVKSFLDPSPINDFKLALGQYLMYRALLEVTAPERNLYLAISQDTYADFFQRKAIQLVVQRYQVAQLVVNVAREEIVQWIS
jgi:hypothetical protein